MNEREESEIVKQDAKALLLQKLLEGRKSDNGIKKTGKKFMKASFAQERLWFLEQMNPGLPVYNMNVAVKINGMFDRITFQKSFDRVIEKQESLRTVFQIVEGEVYQNVGKPYHLEIEYQNMPGITRERVEELFQKNVRVLFNITEGPLVRCMLIESGSKEFWCCIAMHHLITDGWSLGVLVKDIFTEYMSSLSGVSLPHVEKIQYTDYTDWQFKKFERGAYQKDIDYWKKKLEGELTDLQLETDFPRKENTIHKGEKLYFTIDEELAVEIRHFDLSKGNTLFMNLLAIYKVLLFRYTQEEDIIVGSPIACRNQKEIEGIIGFFVNTMALRDTLTSQMTFHEVCDSVRNTALEAYSHQEYPFDKIIEKINPDRNLTDSPVFRTIMVLQNSPVPELKLKDLSMEPVEIHSGTTKFDILFTFYEECSTLKGAIEYDSKLFKKSTILRLISHYQSIAKSVLINPELKLKDIEFLTPEEDKQFGSKATEQLFKSSCIQEVFEEQVAKFPNRPALEFEDEIYTYSELNAAANKVASYLRKQGVRRNDLVGLYMDKSAEMLVGILAILKAGGAYVPLDPSYPSDRIHMMVEDADLQIIVTKESFVHTMEYPGVLLVCIEEKEIQNEVDKNLTLWNQKDDYAYVIYTSGSTGKPKGVLVTHKNVTRLFAATDQWFYFNETDVWTMFHSFAFDFSVWEIWGALLYGGKLIVVPYWVSRSPEVFYDMLAAKGITVLSQTPSAFKQILMVEEKMNRKNIGNLRYVVFGGEALNLEDLRGWFERHGDSKPEMVNMYGITETTVHVTYRVIHKADLETSSGSIIGVPIKDLTLYVLDRYQCKVPWGVPGEMYVGGDGVTAQYLNREELCKERFIKNPFGIEDNDILYRTGDLAKINEAGDLVYMGRIDNQIKIRGFRIELGEIAAAAKSFPQVEDAFITDVKAPSGDKNIVAFIVKKELNKQEKEEHINNETVDKWEMIFNTYYEENSSIEDKSLNITGWNSSYDNGQIPLIEMNSWVKETVDEIKSLHCKKILEIGCGSGMLLCRVAQECDAYYGTDLSCKAIEYVSKELVEKNSQLGNVELFTAKADDFSIMQGKTIDGMVINSVIQYFPSQQYLIDVLKKTALQMNNQGKIFLGDVRNKDLLEEFIFDIEMFKANREITLDEIENDVKLKVQCDNELIISPAFFYELKNIIPSISHVEIRLKKSPYSNEMIRFRYDVVLYLGKHEYCVQDSEIEWKDAKGNLDQVKQYLYSSKKKMLLVKNITNNRVSSLLQQYKMFQNRTTNNLEEILNNKEQEDIYAINPQTVIETFEQEGYQVKILLFAKQEKQYFNALIYDKALYPSPIVPNERMEKQNIEKLTTCPLNKQSFEVFQRELTQHMKKKLPAYMIPGEFIFTDKFPMTINGKIDKKKLSSLSSKKENRSLSYVPPRTETEKKIAEIWEELFDMRPIGIKDEFFEIGGHSMLATKLMFKLRERLAIDIPLKLIFQRDTIEALSAYVDNSVDESEKPVSSEYNMEQDVYLEEFDLPEKRAESRNTIFLTGATGFLGAFLLQKIIENEKKVICLVRAEDINKGFLRIKKNLQKYFLWKESYTKWIQVVIGDLSKERLGLDRESYEYISEHADVILHNGAQVNFIAPYEQLKKANVDGTREIVSLAACKKIKQVEFISSLFVFSKKDEHGCIGENQKPSFINELKLGYLQTKWVDEKILELAKEKGIPVNIYRIGRVAGDSRTGICPEKDFVWLLIKLGLYVHSFPDISMPIEFMPADYMSDIIMKCVNQQLGNQTYHIFNLKPVRLNRLCKVIQSLGFKLENESYKEWIDKIMKTAESDTSNDIMFSIVPLLRQGWNPDEQIHFLREKVDKLLEKEKLSYSVGDEILTKYLSFFQK